MAFIFNFFKHALFTPKTSDVQETVDSGQHPTPLSPCERKRKARSPSDIVPSVEFDEDDIVPSIEVDETAYVQKTSRAKKRKTARKRKRANRALDSRASQRHSVQIKEEPRSPEPLLAEVDSDVRVAGSSKDLSGCAENISIPECSPKILSRSSAAHSCDESANDSFVDLEDYFSDTSQREQSEISSTSLEFSHTHSACDVSFISSDVTSSHSTHISNPASPGIEQHRDRTAIKKSNAASDISYHILKQKLEARSETKTIPSIPDTTSNSTSFTFKSYGRVPKAVDWSSPDSMARELDLREAEIAEKTCKWHPADAQVYREIRLRPLKPTLPPAWKMDFPGFPPAIFAANESAAFIKPRRLRQGGVPDFSGPYALKKVFNSGIDVRSALQLHRPPEKHIKKAIEWFIRWTLEDGGLRKKRAYLPLISIQVGSKNEAVVVTQNKLVHKMQQLKSRWTVALEDCEDRDKNGTPPIYGILITHSVVAIISPMSPDGFGMEGDGAQDQCRVLTILDCSQNDQDVWNALAVAILAVHARDVLLEFLDGRTLKRVEVETDGPDPDV